MKNPTINMMPLNQRLAISKGKKTTPVRTAARTKGQTLSLQGAKGTREELLITNKGSKQARPPKTGGKAPKGKAFC